MLGWTARTDQPGLASPGLDWTGTRVAWTGLDRIGLDWIVSGLDCSGLD